jgi:hypothetical protein
MKIENLEFVSKMQNLIELDPEAVEIIGFGDKWNERLESGSRFMEESDEMRKRTIWVYYVALVSVLFATGGLALPAGACAQSHLSEA